MASTEEMESVRISFSTRARSSRMRVKISWRAKSCWILDMKASSVYPRAVTVAQGHAGLWRGPAAFLPRARNAAGPRHKPAWPCATVTALGYTEDAFMSKIQQLLARQEIFTLIRDDLARVEKEIRTDSISSVDAITAIGQYLHASGGKRLRPALLLLCARACGARDTDLAVRLGAVVELIHTA